MSDQILSIFSFARREKAVATAPATIMIVDLENLTPENLAAFFPSEHATGKGEGLNQ